MQDKQVRLIDFMASPERIKNIDDVKEVMLLLLDHLRKLICDYRESSNNQSRDIEATLLRIDHFCGDIQIKSYECVFDDFQHFIRRNNILGQIDAVKSFVADFQDANNQLKRIVWELKEKIILGRLKEKKSSVFDTDDSELKKLFALFTYFFSLSKHPNFSMFLKDLRQVIISKYRSGAKIFFSHSWGVSPAEHSSEVWQAIKRWAVLENQNDHGPFLEMLSNIMVDLGFVVSVDLQHSSDGNNADLFMHKINAESYDYVFMFCTRSFLFKTALEYKCNGEIYGSYEELQQALYRLASKKDLLCPISLVANDCVPELIKRAAVSFGFYETREKPLDSLKGLIKHVLNLRVNHQALIEFEKKWDALVVKHQLTFWATIEASSNVETELINYARLRMLVRKQIKIHTKLREVQIQKNELTCSKERSKSNRSNRLQSSTSGDSASLDEIKKEDDRLKNQIAGLEETEKKLAQELMAAKTNLLSEFHQQFISPKIVTMSSAANDAVSRKKTVLQSVSIKNGERSRLFGEEDHRKVTDQINIHEFSGALETLRKIYFIENDIDKLSKYREAIYVYRDNAVVNELDCFLYKSILKVAMDSDSYQQVLALTDDAYFVEESIETLMALKERALIYDPGAVAIALDKKIAETIEAKKKLKAGATLSNLGGEQLPFFSSSKGSTLFCRTEFNELKGTTSSDMSGLRLNKH